MKLEISFLPFVLFLGACSRDACPRQLPAVVNQQANEVAWGGDSAKVTATIRSVAAVCLRDESQATDAGGVKHEARVTYSLAATAHTSYSINNPAYLRAAETQGGLHGTVIFEAVTANGVVLGSSAGTISITLGTPPATVSAKISNLSAAQIAKVTRLSAKWQFGRGD